MRQTCLLMEVYTMEPYYSLRPSPQPPEEGGVCSKHLGKIARGS